MNKDDTFGFGLDVFLAIVLLLNVFSNIGNTPAVLGWGSALVLLGRIMIERFKGK